jgi:hypothetical protein
VQYSKVERLMSALGQKQTLRRAQLMSALPPKADIAERSARACFVPRSGRARQVIRFRCEHTGALTESGLPKQRVHSVCNASRESAKADLFMRLFLQLFDDSR